ncbi:hypothetical protein ACQP1S_12235 [Micromonospora matsumotoense]|uniref:hypothetical protein n=1 Tax=Micromonospora matsumotoense TaxID=121616 RepID=UPI003D922DC2
MLRRRRERRDADPTREPVAIELPAAVFDGQLVDPALDDARLAQVEPALRDAWAQTAGYAQGIDPVEVTDRAALVRIDQLRVALEAALGQRITFRGERRESSGVRITLRIDELWAALGPSTWAYSRATW